MFVTVSCSNGVMVDMATPKIETDIEEAPISLNASEQVISSKINSFSISSFANLMKTCPNLARESFVYSPLSVSINLALCETGSNGKTATQIREVLGISDFSTDCLEGYYQKLTEGLANVDTSTVFISANSIWGDSDIAFKPDFCHKAEQYFDADLKIMDMHSPSTVDAINEWCFTKTNGLIKEIVQRSWESPKIFVANAVYFNAKWPENYIPVTDKRVFHSMSGDSECQFLRFKGYLHYVCAKGYQAISLPYGNGSYNLLLVLPADGKSIEETADFMDVVFDKLLSSQSPFPYYVECSFPEFKIDSNQISLKELLKSMGITDAFDPILADFSGISNYNKMYISSILQKSYVEVNEMGTEAAAVTAAMGTSSADLQPVRIIMDKPFLFCIYEKSSGTILFEGQMI